MAGNLNISWSTAYRYLRELFYKHGIDLRSSKKSVETMEWLIKIRKETKNHEGYKEAIKYLVDMNPEDKKEDYSPKQEELFLKGIQKPIEGKAVSREVDGMTLFENVKEVYLKKVEEVEKYRKIIEENERTIKELKWQLKEFNLSDEERKVLKTFRNLNIEKFGPTV
jgi:hypothetical protein